VALALALAAALVALPAAAAPAPKGSTLEPGWDEYSVEWSPDGTLILIGRTYEPPRGGLLLELAAVRPDGSGRRRLGRPEQTDLEEWDFAGAWSPDGRRVAFTRRLGLDLEERLYVINADGSGQQRLTPAQPDAYDYGPAWSPDGRRLVFVRSVSPETEAAGLFTISAEGGDLRQLTHGDDSSPAWSPDGDLIAFARRERGASAVYVVQPDGGELRRLGTGDAPSWSPDSTRIMVASSGALYALPRDGSASTLLASGSSGSWSPDGSRIAFLRGRSAFVAPARGGTPRLVHRAARGSSINRPAWSPDGRALAFGDRGPCLAFGVHVLELATRELTRITNDCRLVGTAGRDILRGTRERDVLRGLAGNDFLDANPGDRPNEYAGRDDDDFLDGGSGADVLWGRRGVDLLVGGPGRDRLRGGRGTDRLLGGQGDDFLDGGRYLDRLDGGEGSDVVLARDGLPDRVRCGPGRDRVVADRRDLVDRDCEVVVRS
jgi:Tol biopolymer transport system component